MPRPARPPSSTGPSTARLSCGCLLAFRPGVEGSPITVVLQRKGDGCPLADHVGGLPLFDHREALRPATRQILPAQPDYGDEN
jgi:hypothetical protein